MATDNLENLTREEKIKKAMEMAKGIRSDVVKMGEEEGLETKETKVELEEETPAEKIQRARELTEDIRERTSKIEVDQDVDANDVVEDDGGGGAGDTGAGDPLDASDNEVIDKVDTVDLTGLVSTYQDSLNEIRDKMDTARQDYLDSLDEQRTETKSFFDKMISGREDLQEERPDLSDIYEETLKEYGVTPETFETQKKLINEIAVSQSELAEVDAELVAAENKVDNFGMPDIWARGRKAQLQRQASAKKSAIASKAEIKAAQLEALRGNTAQAQSFAKTAVDLKATEWEQKVSDFEFIQQTKADMLDALNANEKEIFNSAYEYNLTNLQLAKEEGQQKMQYIIDAATQGIELPVSLDDSLGDIITSYTGKVAPVIATQYQNELAQVNLSSQFKEVNGVMTQIVYDENQNIVARNPVGLGTKSFNEIMTAKSDYETSMAQIDTIGNYVDGITWRPEDLKDSAGFIIQQSERHIGQTDQDLVQYLAQKEAYMSSLTRAAGEKGVLTDKDIARIEKAFPNPFWDTKETAKNKMVNVRSVFRNIMEGKIKAYVDEDGSISENLDDDSRNLLLGFMGKGQTTEDIMEKYDINF